MIRTLVRATLVLALGVAPAWSQGAPPAQAKAAPSAPPIRRWLDVQQLQLASRFRWIENTAGRQTSSSIQWQPQIRARFLFDAKARYAVHVGMFSGNNFISGWNNTGAGIGDFQRFYNVKQLFVAAEPVKGLGFEVGGLYPSRGENTEITSYDNDGFLLGSRALWRPAKSRLTLVSVTIGHIGDLTEVNVFKRFDKFGDTNYGQVLVMARAGPYAAVSGDYVYEDGRRILREGLTVRPKVKALRALRVEAYERVDPDNESGFNAAIDLAGLKKLTLTTGVASVDAAYGPYNADRFLTGTRAYGLGAWALTPDFSLAMFYTEAIGNNRPLPIERRFEMLATYNALAPLKRARVF